MKKSISIFLFTVLWFLIVGLTCEERNVEVPVVGSDMQPVDVNSSDGSFNEIGEFDASELIEKIRNDNNFDAVISVELQGITYKITENESNPSTVIEGEIRVNSQPTNTPKKLLDIQDLNLNDVENTKQTPALESEGVEEINNAISIYRNGQLTGATGRIFFQVRGTATPAPPPNVKFKLEVTVTLTVIGVVKVDVPTSPL